MGFGGECGNSRAARADGTHVWAWDRRSEHLARMERDWAAHATPVDCVPTGIRNQEFPQGFYSGMGHARSGSGTPGSRNSEGGTLARVQYLPAHCPTLGSTVLRYP